MASLKYRIRTSQNLCLPDNAYDPDVNAKQIWIDKTVINDRICLTFTDNGNGMTADKLHKMLRCVQRIILRKVMASAYLKIYLCHTKRHFMS